MFVDKVTIKVEAGNGGDGKLSFRHQKNHKGGPDGGNGGNGGSIVVRASHNSSSLYKYRVSKTYRAEHGEVGGTNRRAGANGNDLILIVPPGTIVAQEGKIMADLTVDAQETIIAKGGAGGNGNAHFTSSTRQAPRFAELGERGEKKELELELRVIAEVGIVGLPNAGKSTLLTAISNARPKIANYPFTTLVPNLGMVKMGDEEHLWADIPGLIEGASSGKGLGDEFLRHVSRSKILVHLIDGSAENPIAAKHIIENEIKKYDKTLAKKPQVVVINKIDSLDEKTLKSLLVEFKKEGLEPTKNLFLISAAARLGIEELLIVVTKEIKKAPKVKKAAASMPVITLADIEKSWQIEQDGDNYVVSGAEIEKLASRTNFAQIEAKMRLRRILKARGILAELERRGAKSGSNIEIAGKKLQW